MKPQRSEGEERFLLLGRLPEHTDFSSKPKSTCWFYFYTVCLFLNRKPITSASRKKMNGERQESVSSQRRAGGASGAQLGSRSRTPLGGSTDQNTPTRRLTQELPACLSK